MKFISQSIPEIVLLEPNVFGDDRGYFFESFNEEAFCRGIGQSVRFVQDNESYSCRGVLRGLHYQIEHAQGKLVRVAEGAVFDVAVDLRKGSPTFGRWVGAELSAENKRQLWVPAGFAHGFLVLSEYAKFLYKVTDYRFAEHERCLHHADPKIGIRWPDGEGVTHILSEKDASAALLADAEAYQ